VELKSEKIHPFQMLMLNLSFVDDNRIECDKLLEQIKTRKEFDEVDSESRLLLITFWQCATCIRLLLISLNMKNVKSLENINWNYEKLDEMENYSKLIIDKFSSLLK